jgi:hypothetical protein
MQKVIPLVLAVLCLPDLLKLLAKVNIGRRAIIANNRQRQQRRVKTERPATALTVAELALTTEQLRPG